jgi:hypothetical protein
MGALLLKLKYFKAFVTHSVTFTQGLFGILGRKLGTVYYVCNELVLHLFLRLLYYNAGLGPKGKDGSLNLCIAYPDNIAKSSKSIALKSFAGCKVKRQLLGRRIMENTKILTLNFSTYTVTTSSARLPR